MNSLLYTMSEWSYIIGIEVLIGLIILFVVIWQKFSHEKQLTSFYLDSPVAILLVDCRTGKLELSNRPAMQLLGIRRIGHRFLYPSSQAGDDLWASLQHFDSKANRKLTQAWRFSDIQSKSILFSGKKTHYNGRSCWLLYAELQQDELSENEQVKASLKLASTALDSLSELIYVKDTAGNIITTNQAFIQFWEGRLHEANIQMDGMLKGRKVQKRWTIDPQGRSRLLETTQTALLSDDGEVLGSLGISHDVTDWFKMQQDLREEMEKRRGTEIALSQRDTILESLLKSSPDAIALFNENRIYEACNQAFVDSLGIAKPSDLLGKRIEDLLPEMTYKRFIETDTRVMNEGISLRFRDEVVSDNGQSRWYDVVKSPYEDPNSGSKGVLLMARDVTENYLAEQKLEEMNQELERLSFLDSLTQIGNRRRFDEQLEIMLNLHRREKNALTVMICDIDFFKDFNDNYGHQKGDEILRKVAHKFQEVLTRTSDCVARYGGEEFGFIVPNTNHHGAQVIASNIHKAIWSLNIEHKYSEINERLTLSIGVVSIVPTNTDTADKIIQLADLALYSAKNSGRNQTKFHLG